MNLNQFYVDTQWEPNPLQDWEPDHALEDHLPANWDWLDRMRAEYQASLAVRQAAQKAPELPAGLYLVKGGRAGKSRSTAHIELVPRPVRRRYGLRAIIRSANELEFALNHIRREPDIERLLAMEPHLRRVDQIVRQLTRAAAKARRQTEREYSLFEE